MLTLRSGQFLLAIAMLATLGACGGAERAERTDASKQPPSRLLAASDFKAVLADPARTTINVHTPDEGQLAGTELTIPFDRIAARRDELPPPSQPIALYCRTGRMSQTAATTLARLGYRNIVDLRGGMLAWRQSGRSIRPS